jgi:hypothetical protein
MERDFLSGALGRFGLPERKTLIDQEGRLTIMRQCRARRAVQSLQCHKPLGTRPGRQIDQLFR